MYYSYYFLSKLSDSNKIKTSSKIIFTVNLLKTFIKSNNKIFMFNEKETATAFLQEISNYLYWWKRRFKYSFAFCVNCDLIFLKFLRLVKEFE